MIVATAGLALLFLLRGVAAAAQPAVAELIYSGGPIVTVDEQRPAAEAVAVRGGLIVAVGALDEVRAWQGPDTRLVDLEGHTLIPGLIDAHGHVSGAGILATTARLLPPPDGTVGDIAGLQQCLRDWLARNESRLSPDAWIVGFGYDDSQLTEQRSPHAGELDAVTTSRPLLAIHQSGHLGVVNSRALAELGISADTVDPPGGRIGRRAGSREPDGVLEEAAFIPAAAAVLAGGGVEQRRQVARAGVELYASFGYTTAQEGRAWVDTVATLASLAEDGLLPIDVVAYPDITTARATIAPPWLGRDYRGHFRIGGAKLSLDGSPQGRTAWLTEPYFRVPDGKAADYRGYAAMSDAAAMQNVELAFARGWQLLVHANGDAAIDQLIAAVRAATARYGKADRRTVAIHAQTARRDQVEAFAALGITPSFFTAHTFYWGDWHREVVLGPQRAANISPTGWAQALGLRYTTHHDAPVLLPDAMRVLSATVNRRTRSGYVLGPDQRATVLDALRAQTSWAAWQYFEEGRKGSITVGKLADFAILDRNPLAVPAQELASIRVLETVKEGRSVYRREMRTD